MGRFDSEAGPKDGIKVYMMASYELSTSSENHSLLSAPNILIHIIFRLASQYAILVQTIRHSAYVSVL